MMYIGLIISTLVQELYMISSHLHICNKLCILWLSSPFKEIDILGSIAIKCFLYYSSLKWCGKDVNFRPFDSVEK